MDFGVSGQLGLDLVRPKNSRYKINQQLKDQNSQILPAKTCCKNLFLVNFQRTPFKSTHKPFYRLVKEISQAYSQDCKFQQAAMQALQDDAESYITQYFAKSQANAIHAGRKTILVSDGKKD